MVKDLHTPRTCIHPSAECQGQCQNQCLLWTARLGPCSALLRAAGGYGQDERAPNTSWKSLPQTNAATALSLHRTRTKENLQQAVPSRAPLHPNTQEQLHTPPRCSTEPVLLHCHMLPGPSSAWSCPRACMDLYMNMCLFLMLHLWAVRSPGSISATFLGYRRADTRQEGQHLGIAHGTGNRAALWHMYLDQPGCISHLGPSSTTTELKRVCDGACSGFQCISNNAHDIICFACIMVWCLENKHLGFASTFIFNKYLSFAPTINSPQQTIIQ